MTLNELKKNEKMFGRLSSGEKAIFVAAGRKNCVSWTDSKGWVSTYDAVSSERQFYDGFVYRIHKDYNRKPKEIKQAVFLDHQTGTYIFYYDSANYVLSQAVDFKMFSHYEYENGTRSVSPRLTCSGHESKVPAYVVFKGE